MEAIKKNRKIIIVISAIMIVLLICAALVLSEYVFIGGRFIPRNAVFVDLSGAKIEVPKMLRFRFPEYIGLENCGISADDYDAIRAAFPDSRIVWSVPLSSGAVSNQTEELTIDSISASDLPLLKYFDNLSVVNAEGVSDWELLYTLQEQYPDINVSWEIALNEEYYSANLTSLSLKEPVGFLELNEKLKAFKKIKRVSLEKDNLSTDEKLSLLEAYPAISFHFTVEEFGKRFSNSTPLLDFSNNNEIDIDRLVQIAPLLEDIKTVDFSGCVYSNEDMYKVVKAFPDATVCWQFEIYGVAVSSTDEEIDFSGIQISDTSEIENALPYFKNLNKVVMCKCGIEDEEMDLLNKKYEDIRFVWTIYLGGPRASRYPRYELRTDTTYFISSLQIGEENAYKLTDETAAPLKYCTDMIALDLGHNKLTNCEFCRNMPKLRFFIAAGNFQFADLSALADCKELFYVELMFCPVSDLSPLLACKELRHLNVSACPTRDSVRSVISQMTWLERLYMAGRTCYYPEDTAYVYSDEFLPNTEKWLLGLDFYGPWRTHPAYFEMRDALGGAYYMARKPET